MERRYETFNYPGASENSKTLLTGIRSVKRCKYCCPCAQKERKQKVYISGFYKEGDELVSFVYKGKLKGGGRKGKWNNLGYPSSPEATVVSTSLYGPNNGAECNNVQVVGNYLTKETGSSALGCLYEGPLDGSGKWTTLVPPSPLSSSEPVLNTIAHSTMGGLVVGNYDTQLNEGRAFLYDIRLERYYEIQHESAKSITAYGIWHNGCHSYTICGGFSELSKESNVGAAYLVDWNNKHKKLSNWRTYHYDNDHLKSLVTHFDGITGNGRGRYNLTGDWVGAGKLNGGGGAFFASVKRKASGKFSRAAWSPVSVPKQSITSGNSVDRLAVIGVYTSDGEDMVNGYVSVPRFGKK